MNWKLGLVISFVGWVAFLVYLAERGDARARRKARRRAAQLEGLKDLDSLTDEQADRLWQAIQNHPATTSRKRYYR